MRTVTGLYARYDTHDTAHSRGGIGSIYLTAYPSLIYKEYHRADKAPARPGLDRLVNIGRDILLRQRLVVCATPESSINWPLDIVVDVHGRTKGVMLPAIPPALFNEFAKPRGLEFLIMRRANPPSANVRVFLLLRMAEILAFLDDLRLVHGDINGKNLAWAAAPEPCMYLIDCDGIVDQMPPPMVGVQALGWTDPRLMDRLIPAHDHLSDWYALALAMYRGLLLVPGNLHARNPDGTWPAPAEIPSPLDARIAALLHRGLDNPLAVSQRPSPAQWVQTLVDVFLPNGSYDHAALRHLDRLAGYTSSAFIPLPPIRPAPTHHPDQGPFRPPSPADGWFGRSAMTGGAFWHIAMLATTFCCAPAVLVYLGVALYQTARAPVSSPGRKRALVMCAGYAVLATAFALFTFVILPQTSDPQ